MTNTEIMSFVKKHIDEMQVLTKSTNITGYLDMPCGKVIVKKQWLDASNLSPFWKRLQFLYNSDFTAQRKAMPEITCILGTNPHISCAELMGTDEELQLSVFSYMQGCSWEPDEFPESAKLSEQLGMFIGYLHSQEYDNPIIPGCDSKAEFPERLRQYIIEKMDGTKELPMWCQRFLNEGLKTSGYVFMMADISANQFCLTEKQYLPV